MWRPSKNKVYLRSIHRGLTRLNHVSSGRLVNPEMHFEVFKLDRQRRAFEDPDDRPTKGFILVTKEKLCLVDGIYGAIRWHQV